MSHRQERETSLIDMSSVPGLAEAVESSAAPAAVRVALDRLAEAHSDLGDRLAAEPRLRDALVAVTGASRSLTDVCMRDPSALDVLDNLERRLPVDDTDAGSLRRWKQLELLRIAARDLLGIDRLEVVGAALAAMAEAVLSAACQLATSDRRSGDERKPIPDRSQEGLDGLVVIGMGKLGGAELNYASDVDVMFVGGTDAQIRAIAAIARTCFRVDADLRPEGRNGPLTRSLESYEAYWDRWAQAWERQALLKARPVAGDPELGQRFLAAARQQVWERPFTANDLRSVREMKARTEREIQRKGLTDREVKRGRGGIRDIEFAVQLLQLVHGRHDPGLRSPTTLDALAELSGAGYVDPAAAGALEDAYRFLRTVEHRLQLVDELQTHALPTDATDRTRLARVLGFRDTGPSEATAVLEGELRRHQHTVRSIHERLYFRPLLEAFISPPPQGVGPVSGRLSIEAAEARLAAFGFADADRTRQAVAELTRGLARTSRLMRQLLPLLLGWLSETPDPDLGLLGLRRLASGRQRSTELVGTFRDSPQAARRLCQLLGTSRLLTDTLYRNPDLVAALGDDEMLAPLSRADMLEAATTALSWRDNRDEQAAALARLKQREQLRIAVSDVLDPLEIVDPKRFGGTTEKTALALTDLAEAVMEAALAVLAPPVPFAVVAMGRFGGRELSYASDLDVLFVYDGTTPSHFEEVKRAAQALLRFLGGATPVLGIYDVDPDLRPEGRNGPLARSLDSYRSYYERWAETWELQALIRARPVAGDPELGQRFSALVEPFVWRQPFPDDAAREIRRMKARVERERIPATEDSQFHLKLGRGSLSDIEWTTQLLQLQHGVRSPGTMAALQALIKAEALDPADGTILAEAYRFCERVRNRWFLVNGAPGDSLPTQADQLAILARSLGLTAPELREHYRRLTRRARQVVERLFYGRQAGPAGAASPRSGGTS